MAEILADVSSFVTAAVGWVTSFTTTITSTPLLLMFVITAFVGMGVGLIKRLVRI